MADETEIGSAPASDRGRHLRGSQAIRSPFQTRAQFLKNWSWESVIRINRAACKRGRAQQGTNSETGAAGAAQWENLQDKALTLEETINYLRAFHKLAPFLFFNGNTFATIGREMAFALFS